MVNSDEDIPTELIFYTSPDSSGNMAQRMVIKPAGDIGMGVADPDSALEIFNTSTQLKLSYDATDFCTFAVDTNHDITITPSSTGQIKLQPTNNTR